MEKEVYIQMRAVEENHWWFVARRKIIDSALYELLPNRENRILDAGCGTGGNLALLAKHGDVSGIEMDSDALKFARERNVGRVVQGSFPDSIPKLDCTFDLITMLDVLEHVEKDTETLRNLSHMLGDGGCILVTVPAHPFLWSEHDVRHHHKRRYTRLELERVAKEAGLNVKKITYFNMWLFPLVIIVRMLKKLIPTSSLQDDDAVPSAPINSLFTFIFSSEAILIKKFKLPIGVSLLAVLLKKSHG